MSTPENQTTGEELNTKDKLKVIGGLGVALVGEVIGGTGIEELNTAEAAIGFGVCALSALYAIRHMSPQTRQELKDIFRH